MFSKRSILFVFLSILFEQELNASLIFDYKFLTDNEKDFFEKNLKKLESNVIGNKVLEKLNKQLESKKITIQNGKNNLFDGPSSSLEINFNEVMDKNYKAYITTVKAVSLPIPQDTGETNLKTFYEVGKVSYSFHFVVGHELIHATHFFEEKETYLKDLRRFDGSYWPLPLDEESKRISDNIWNKNEEQRTILGKNVSFDDDDNLSEFSVLLAEGISPRYAYQNVEHHFYESEDTIKKLFLNRIPSTINFNELKREDWDFNKESAQESNYNCLTYKKNFTFQSQKKQSQLKIGRASCR